MVAWTTEVRFSGTVQFTTSEDGRVITMGAYTFSTAGTATADTLLEDIEAGCAESIEREEAKVDAQADRGDRDAEIKNSSPKLIMALAPVMSETGTEPPHGDPRFDVIVKANRP